MENMFMFTNIKQIKTVYKSFIYCLFHHTLWTFTKPPSLGRLHAKMFKWF